MGNKSSSSSDYRRYGPPPGMLYPPYGPPPPPFHQSMMSLHHGPGTDSGYMTSPTDSANDRWRLHSSRRSLHEFAEPPPNHFLLPPPDPKLLKKWQKKQKKMLKKLGPHAALIAPPPPFFGPPPPPIHAFHPHHRAYSMDNLNNLNSGFPDAYSDVSLRKPRNSWSRGDPEKRLSLFEEERIPEVPPARPRSTISSDRGFSFNGLRRTSTDASTTPSRVTSADISINGRRSPRQAPLPPLSSIPTSSQSPQNGSGDKDSLDSNRGSRGSSSNEQKSHTESINELLESAEPPVKVTPEAQTILERNAKLFKKNNNEKQHEDVRKPSTPPKRSPPTTINQKHGEKNAVEEREDVPNGNANDGKSNEKNNRNNGFYALQRSDRYSSFSSLTPSTANIKTGDGNTDIDFSWVRDIESSLNQEHRRGKFDEAMPVRYFGIESQGEEFRPPAIEAFADERRTAELAQIRSNVKSKAAMFDAEAQHAQQRLREQRQQAAKYRSRSMSRDPYIPSPDYTGDGNGFAKALSVDTGGVLEPLPPSAVVYRYFNNHREHERTCSPSERRIRRFEHSTSNSSFDSNCSITAVNNGGKYPTMDTRLPSYTGPKNCPPRYVIDPTSPEVLQRNRRYDATEYYRNNVRADRDRAILAATTEKPWRASVAY